MKNFAIYFYDSFIRPNRIFEKERNTLFVVIIFAISMLSFSISLLYVSYAKSGIFAILFTALSLFIYFMLSSFINAALIHFIASIFNLYDKKYSVRKFTLDMMFIHKVFIVLLPLALLFSVFPKVVYKVYFFIALFAIAVYYFYNLYYVIKKNISMTDGAQALMLMAFPLIFSLAKMIFIVFNINIIVRFLMAFFA